MNNIMIFILNSIFLLCYSLVPISLGGLAIELIEKHSMRYLRKSFGNYAIWLTGFGTVVHELSHLVFVVLGGMKLKEVKLFRPIAWRNDGTLGYVSYAIPGHNTSIIRRIYNRVFLIPIGIAPIVGGTLIILLSMKLCLPLTFDYMFNEITLLFNSFDGFSLSMLSSYIGLAIKMIQKLFVIENIKTISFWIFMFVMLSVASHMSLSLADIKSSIKGIPYLLIIIYILNALFLSAGMGTNYLYDKVTVFNGYIIPFVCVAVIFSILNLFVAFIINKIVSLIK